MLLIKIPFIFGVLALTRGLEKKPFVLENLKFLLKAFQYVMSMAVHGIHCLSCSNTNDVINMLPEQL